ELVRSMAKQVDGALLVAPRLSNRTIAELGRDVPFTVVNRRVKNLPCVLMDVASGVRQAITHLADLGHRDLTVVTGPRASWTGQELGRAAAERAAELGLGLHLIGPNPPTEDGGATAAEEVVELGGTAVLTHNDLMAIGLIRGLRHLGRQVPRDMSVIGVDNTDAGRHSDPSLTTVDMPTSAAGRTPIDLLLQSRSGATAAEEVVELGGTAVLTHNALMAIGLIRGLRHLGRQVPRDMSVIGVDNTDAGRHSDPSLTTVDMPTSAAGRTAIDLLLQS